LELLVDINEDADLLAQVFDLSVESGNAVLQIRDQEVWCRRGELGTWGWFLVWVQSSLGAAMGSAQARLVGKGIRALPGLDGHGH